jgi:NOL1/NOP2/sun family putative RNA methylase
MFVGQVAAPQKNDFVLDLCAAPGGKSTHLSSFLDNTGFLLSNEISRKRAKVLVENLERFGARNYLATNTDAATLAQYFPNFFDKIVIDTPCSGEGMFRKNPDAMDYWTQDYPTECASLSREILQSAVKMLKTGGQLIYSTCTFAPEENEQVIAWLLESGDFEMLEIDKAPGMDNGRPEWATGNPELTKACRIFPHKMKGEGHFIAKLQFTGANKSKKIRSLKSNLTPEQRKLWTSFAQETLNTAIQGTLYTFKDQLYSIPAAVTDIKGLPIARAGLHLGTFKKNRFEPSFALGIALKPSEVKKTISISDEQWETYAKGEIITLTQEPSQKNGWYQLVAGGNGFGFAKAVGKQIKNNYPKGLRFV